MMSTQFSTIEGTDENDNVHFISCLPTFLANITFQAMLRTKQYDDYKRLTLRPTVLKRCGTGWI